MKKYILLYSILFVLLFTTRILAQDMTLTVEDLTLCTSIEDRQPMGADITFYNDVERVYCFSKILGAGELSAITHIWYYDDKEMARIEMFVKSKSWRTWSSKKIVSPWVGSWRVDIIDEDGEVIASKKFEIIPRV